MTKTKPPHIFLSVAGPGRVPARLLASALRRAGLTVFVDRESLGDSTGITVSIAQELSTSAALVAYSLRSFAERPAC